MVENMNKNRRPFATGSKRGPDELDHFLEEKGFYRKHVARDASSLFRVVSEQVFDVQIYHDKVRQDCATFMEVNIKDYANEVDKNFYNYVGNLRRSRTFGTLLELRVIARMYKRNVVLFEPNQKMETISRDFIKDDEYNAKEPIRVFYSHKDKHFDTIYTMDNVERLAECQAIVYEILYTDVFKLPDVKYAVERMLHDQEEEHTLPLEEDGTKYKNANGEILTFDSPENTNCVLKDPRTCHFHNQVDFEEVVLENKDAITIINRSDDPGKLKIYKPVDGFLYNKDKSCVRQLLDEKITPFPYKVAKALDPSIYRNTEFELWSENRKEQRLKWFDSNGLPLKENDDRYWPYYGDCDKNRRNEPFGIQKCPFDTPLLNDDSFVTIDDDGKKKYYLVNDDYKLGHLTSLEHFQPPKNALDSIIMPVNMHHRNYRNNRRHRGFNHSNNSHHNMSYVSDIERENFQNYNEQDQMYAPQQPIYQEVQYYQYEQNSPPLYQNHPSPQYQYVPQNPYPQPISALPYQPPMVPYAYHQPALYSYPPPQTPAHQNPAESRENPRDSLNLIREGELNSSVNCSPKESIDPNGNDLPLNDMASVQFYYNLGVRYYFASGISRRLENVATQFESLDLNQGSDQNTKNDTLPVPANTPVSAKPHNSGQSGHRYQHNHSCSNMNNNHNRRIYNQNSQPIGTKDKNRTPHNHQRKEIQFNSNVKNVHKVDSGKNVNNQSSGNVIASNSSSSHANNNNVERTSSTLTATSSYGVQTPAPISPPDPQPNQEQQVQHAVPLQVQPQYYQQYAPQNIIPQTNQPLLCYQMENGDLMPVSQAVQPVYYGYSTTPQTPVYYQPQTAQIMDGTINSSDSGVLDISAFAYQQPYPILYQTPTPIYYPQTPLLQTPHVATTPQLAPVFPVTVNSAVQHTISMQELPASDSTGLNENSNTNN